jgi:hypothetical protein
VDWFNTYWVVWYAICGVVVMAYKPAQIVYVDEQVDNINAYSIGLGFATTTWITWFIFCETVEGM